VAAGPGEKSPTAASGRGCAGSDWESMQRIDTNNCADQALGKPHACSNKPQLRDQQAKREACVEVIKQRLARHARRVPETEQELATPWISLILRCEPMRAMQDHIRLRGPGLTGLAKEVWGSARMVLLGTVPRLQRMVDVRESGVGLVVLVLHFG
jgi:hypothetical protein